MKIVEVGSAWFNRLTMFNLYDRQPASDPSTHPMSFQENYCSSRMHLVHLGPRCRAGSGCGRVYLKHGTSMYHHLPTYLPTYLLIIETTIICTQKTLSLSLYIIIYIYIYMFIYVQDTINFFAKDHAQCFHRAAAGGCGTKLRIVVVQGLRGAALLR